MLASTALRVAMRSAEARVRTLCRARVRPYKLLLELTAQCNGRCTLCSIWKTPPNQDRPEMPLAEVEQLFRRSGHDLVWLALSGGEVTLYESFPGVIELARRHCPKLRLVTFTTNGLLPNKARAWAEAIRNAGFDGFVTVSLDGDEATHDGIRGVKGNHALAWTTYHLVVETGVHVHFGLTVGKENERFIERQYADLAHRMKAVTFVHGEGIYGQSNPPNDESIARSLHTICRNYPIAGPGDLLERIYLQLGLRFVERGRSENVVTCGVGHTALHVRPDGTVLLCMFMPPIGNLRDGGSLIELVNSPPARAQLQRIEQGDCRHCWMNCYAPHSILLHPVEALLRGFLPRRFEDGQPTHDVGA